MSNSILQKHANFPLKELSPISKICTFFMKSDHFFRFRNVIKKPLRIQQFLLLNPLSTRNPLKMTGKVNAMDGLCI